VKAVVTGGAGFIGSNLVHELKNRGFDVLVIDDLSNGNPENLPENVEMVQMDIRDKGLIDVFKGFKPHVVFHLAAHIDVRKSLENPVYDFDVNVNGTINIIKGMIESGAEKIIYSSTGGALYGDRTGSTEEIIPDPISPYGASKLAGEYYIKIFSLWKGFRYTILRYANVYGPRQSSSGEAGVVAIFMENLLNRRVPVLYGYGKMLRDYVYVRDVVSANVLSIERGDGETLNIGTGIETSVSELYELVQRITGIYIQPELKEARPGELKVSSLNSDRAREKLGWEPEYSLEKGLKETWEWFRTNR